MPDKKILLINTGGTIGMEASDQGYRVRPNYLADQLKELPELRHPEIPHHEIVEFDPVLDSAQMTPGDWMNIARCIGQHYDEFAGFVVLHGTDTMAYTSSALAFSLQGIAKPIILTGSQIPLCELRTDARSNLLTSMILAGNYPVPEVCVFFGDELLRGCRVIKSSVADFDAFISPNYPALGEVGTSIRLHPERIRPAGNSLSVLPVENRRLGSFRLFPGVSAEVLDNLLRQPLEALVLESYGVGTGPSHDTNFLRVLREAVDRGVVVVSCSQCRHGTISQSAYAASSALHDVGVLSGQDLTVEAALAKLGFLFSQKLTKDEIVAKMKQSLVGELTERAK